MNGTPTKTYPVGVVTIIAQAEDGSGNTDSCSFDITVEDNEDPQASCNDITIQLDANGDASITAADIDDGSMDNCGMVDISIDQSHEDWDCDDVGTNIITLTVNYKLNVKAGKYGSRIKYHKRITINSELSRT